MSVKVGTQAPVFTLESVNMGRVRLADYEKRRVVLVFGRYFGCPVCQMDFDDLIELSKKTETPVIYFTQSLANSARKYLESYDVEFPVIPVPKKEGYRTYKEYGVGRLGITSMIGMLGRARESRKIGKVHGEYEGRETQSPADFVVDKGKITWANRGLFDSEKLLDFLEK